MRDALEESQEEAPSPDGAGSDASNAAGSNPTQRHQATNVSTSINASPRSILEIWDCPTPSERPTTACVSPLALRARTS